MNINQKHESKRRDMPSACLDGNHHFSVKTHWKHAEGMSLRYDESLNLTRPLENA